MFGLEHRDKFKAIFLCINCMYNPVLFAIPNDLWTPTTILESSAGIMRHATNGYI